MFIVVDGVAEVRVHVREDARGSDVKQVRWAARSLQCVHRRGAQHTRHAPVE